MLLPVSANLCRISNSLWIVHDCQSLCICIRSILIYGLKFHSFRNEICAVNISIMHTFLILHIKFVTLTMQVISTMSGGIHSSVAIKSLRNVTKANTLNLVIYVKIKKRYRSKTYILYFKNINAELI